MLNNNKRFNVKVNNLIPKLIEIKNLIEKKRKKISDSEIKSFSNYLDVSFVCAERILRDIYLDTLINKIHNNSYLLISNISQEILDKPYNSSDYYELNKKEYLMIYQKKYC